MTLEKIKKCLTSKINISFIKIYDDSLFHNHPEKGFTHLRILIISNNFINKKLIDRHRLIFSVLSKTLKKNIYSLTLNTYTLNEWESKKFKKNNNIKCLKRK
ncbi:BolA family transcriptional regulator [Buchnera aphidicola (Acyrthosiphon lactucae)]|uniref:BolA family transcriptional regulator n=1 Tax=Buchnera aphidicola (Acyrthosiphon lactucae) TaxID=1241832 RepID=A0A4D6XSL2_9GAMM|nr:BolA family transcriptional regulator [Buchnera aphidicola]QCI17854.1 BolA family transcriptional regulator [Buchnera aphidicola (Acyrthosiphon lactucae)]